MRLFFSVVCLVWIFPCLNGQPATGKIKADPAFNCTGYSIVDPLYSAGNMIDSAYGIAPICKSTNSIEIRLTSTYGPSSIFEYAVVSFDGKKWKGKKYQFNLNPIYVHADSSLARREQKVFIYPFATDSIPILFKGLKANNVFTLPDQKDINVKKTITCGVTYVLSFKCGNQFRTYQFNNTDEYIKQYPRKRAFKNYDSIVRIMNKTAIKE